MSIGWCCILPALSDIAIFDELASMRQAIVTRVHTPMPPWLCLSRRSQLSAMFGSTLKLRGSGWDQFLCSDSQYKCSALAADDFTATLDFCIDIWSTMNLTVVYFIQCVMYCAIVQPPRSCRQKESSSIY